MNQPATHTDDGNFDLSQQFIEPKERTRDMESARDYIKPEGIAASGPYTPIVRVGQEYYISGQGTRDPETGQKCLGEFREQAEIAMANLTRCVKACGLEMHHLVKLTIFLTDMKDLATFNEVYPTFFDNHERMPARSCVAVKELPGGMAVEIEAIARDD